MDQHGLFHEVTTPKHRDTRKEIGRRAKRMAKDLWNRITDICKQKRAAENPHEADLVQRWEKLGADRMRLEELKVLSETFQISRGGRIFPRYASQESRNRFYQKGPRSKPEITHAVQILDRYLEEECSMRPNRRLECLGNILRATRKPLHPHEEVSEQVRWRLRDAETKTRWMRWIIMRPQESATSSMTTGRRRFGSVRTFFTHQSLRRSNRRPKTQWRNCFLSIRSRLR